MEYGVVSELTEFSIQSLQGNKASMRNGKNGAKNSKIATAKLRTGKKQDH